MANSKFDTLLLGDTTLDFVKKINSSFSATQEGLNGLEESSVKSISVEVDNNYVLTISLLDSDGNSLSSKKVDLPLETMVVGARYEDGKIILELTNGRTTEVDVSALVSGLVPDTLTVNNKPLDEDDNITLTQDDIGAGTTYTQYSFVDKNKLAGIQEGAEQNQNAFSKVIVGGATIDAGAKEDTLELVAGANVSLGVEGKKVTISSTGGGSNTGGKVQDVTVNGTSVLDGNIARITIEQLESGRVHVAASAWTTYAMADGTTYPAIQVEETDLALGVFNASGQEIVVQKVYGNDGYLYLCSSTAVDCEIRTINGGGVVNVSGSQAIIDVDELPTEEINEQVLYRVPTATTIFNGEEGTLGGMPVSVITVNSLPEDGVLFTDNKSYTCYFVPNEDKGNLYGYVGEKGVAAFGVKWMEVHTLMNYMAFEGQEVISWGGVISSIDEAITPTAIYVIAGKPALYHHKGGWNKVGEGESSGENSNTGGGNSFGEPSIILAGHRYYGENGKLALRNLTGVTRIDWGDGTVEDFDEGSAEDIYTHQWEVNEDVQLPSGFEIRIFGCTKIGDSAFKVQDKFNDVGNQYITTIVIRSGIEDIGSTINPGYATDNQVTVIMDRYSPPHIVWGTSSSNSFDENVTKIIVPSESVVADYNNYWTGAYTSIIQAPITASRKLYRSIGNVAYKKYTDAALTQYVLENICGFTALSYDNPLVTEHALTEVLLYSKIVEFRLYSMSGSNFVPIGYTSETNDIKIIGIDLSTKQYTDTAYHPFLVVNVAYSEEI